MNTPKEAPVNNTTSTAKVSKSKFTSRVPRYFSDKDTAPLEDVYRDGKLVKGLSEQQKISEGIRPPLAWQAEVKDGKAIGRFQKTAKEREELKAVHTNAKGPTGGSSKGPGRHEMRMTLIIHRVNIHRKKSFHTTLSFKVYSSEVYTYVKRYNDPDKHKLVSSYHYNGQTKIPA